MGEAQTPQQKRRKFPGLTRHQSGYALVMGLVLLGVMSLSIIGLYNSGQVTSEKMRLQNASDAAAYSLATLSSRNLNFISYTNRAMVANQVAIGQMVGLASWAKMIRKGSKVMGTLIKLVPYIGGVLGTVIENAGKALDIGVEKMVKIAIPISDMTIKTLSWAQVGVHGAIHFAMPELFQEVRASNDPDARMNVVTAGASIVQYGRSVKNFMGQADDPKIKAVTKKDKWNLARFDEFEQVVQDSRDDFTKRRTYDWISPIYIPFVFPLRQVKIAKYGGSEFQRVKGKGRKAGNYAWQWTAMDTVGIQQRKQKWSWRKRRFVWKGWKELSFFGISAPIAWGAGHALQKGNKSKYYNYGQYPKCSSWWCNRTEKRRERWGNGAWRNQTSAQFARVEFATRNISHIGGLRKFFDLKKEGHVTRGPALTVLLEKPLNKVKTWNRVLKENKGQAGSRIDIEKYAKASAKMYALAKAEPYFSRAEDLSSFVRADRKREYGNLYNPYWQPRLIDNSRTEKAAAYVLGAT